MSDGIVTMAVIMLAISFMLPGVAQKICAWIAGILAVVGLVLYLVGL